MAKGKFWGRRFFFAGSLLLWIFFGAILILAFTPLTRYLLKPLLIKEDLRQADVIVVLGGGIDKGRYLTLVSSHRLVRGTQLYYEGMAKKIIFSGGVPPHVGVAEGAVLAQEARRLNIAPEDILIEKKSRRTYEQAVEIKKITEPRRWKSLLLVTSCSHMKRAVHVFEQAGFKVYPAPTDPLEKYAHRPLDRLVLFGRIVHEYGAMIYYWGRGWI
jgi:uncharacterized SAM-binding protein YcdF (DUF218 family)